MMSDVYKFRPALECCTLSEVVYSDQLSGAARFILNISEELFLVDYIAQGYSTVHLVISC